MIGKAIAAYIGNRIDRRDGQGGMLGALAGMAALKIARRSIPAAIAVGAAAYGINRLRKRGNAPA